MLKDYTIIETLGLGAFGTVYKVLKKSTNKIYVLKQIPLKDLSQRQTKNAKLESKILSLVKSPYIVRYYDSFEENKILNIVMEYCDGGDLNEFILKNKQTHILLNENVIWNIFLKILIGLAELHKSNIIHRDLKPHNIFLTKNNSDIKIGDFGLAKILENNFAQTLIGTPYYLSPELCEELPYNDKSDVWALGCILYELCTYDHPFNAKYQASLIMKILEQKPKPIHEYYSKNLQNLIYLILDKNYKTRPSCYDILHLPYIIEKLKEFGLYNKIELMYSEKNKNINKSNRNVLPIKINHSNKNLLTNKNYNNNVLFKSKSDINIKKYIIKTEEEKIQKEPKNNYRNYIKKIKDAVNTTKINNEIYISNKIKNTIDEYEMKMKKERINNIINKHPKNTIKYINIMNLENDEEMIKNIKATDIINSIELDKIIDDKLIKMKKEKKKMNINEFAESLNNSISKNNLTNFNNDKNLTNKYEYKYQKVKNKSIHETIIKQINYSFDDKTKQKNYVYSNNKNKGNSNEIEDKKTNYIITKKKLFLPEKRNNNKQNILIKNGNKIIRTNKQFNYAEKDNS